MKHLVINICNLHTSAGQPKR